VRRRRSDRDGVRALRVNTHWENEEWMSLDLRLQRFVAPAVVGLLVSVLVIYFEIRDLRRR
jgi:hypothetical protein